MPNTIFILDDSKLTIATLMGALQHVGINNVQYFRDVYSFKNAFTKNVKVVIVDHHISKAVKGFEVVDFVRDKSPGCKIYIITASEQAKVIADYTEKRVERVILKSDRWIDEIIHIIKSGSELKKKVYPIWIKNIVQFLFSIIFKTNTNSSQK